MVTELYAGPGGMAYDRVGGLLYPLVKVIGGPVGAIAALADALGFLHNDGAGVLAWLPEVGPDHAMLSTLHSDSLAAAVLRGSLITGNATPKWSSLAIGAANSMLQSNGVDPSWVRIDKGDAGSTNFGLGAGGNAGLNTVYGYFAGAGATTGAKTVAVGMQAAYTNSVADIIAIGNFAGIDETAGGLFIDSIDRATEALGRTDSVIYGKYSATPLDPVTQFIRINNALRIGGTPGAAYFGLGLTPVARQTGCAVPTDLATCITAITALRAASNAFGLTTVV